MLHRPIAVFAFVMVAFPAFAQDPKEPAQDRRAEPTDRFPGGSGPKVVFKLPTSWKVGEPKNSMRLAEYQLPGDQKATCLVFWFGEKGAGPVEANIKRWVDGFQSESQPRREVLEPTKGIKVSLVDHSGTYVAPVTPGSEKQHNEPNWRLLGAVVETPTGPIYVRAVGPEAAIAASREDFMSWLKSFRPSPATKDDG